MEDIIVHTAEMIECEKQTLEITLVSFSSNILFRLVRFDINTGLEDNCLSSISLNE